MNLWAKGERRLIQANDGWFDVTDGQEAGVDQRPKSAPAAASPTTKKLKKWIHDEHGGAAADLGES